MHDVCPAAAELREATKPDPALAINDQLITALRAHVDWIDVNAPSYRAVLHGGISSDPVVQAIVEESRAAVVSRLAEAFGYDTLSAVQRTVFRGWVGFLEGACLEWLAARDLSKAQLVDMLAASVFGAIRVAEVAAGDTADPNGLTSSND